MATVAALFDSQLEADRAMSALAAAGYEDIDMRVFEDAAGAPAEPEGGFVMSGATGRLQAYLDPNSGRWFEELDDEAVADFFLNGVQHGGVLVITRPDADDVDAVGAILREHGGRTAEE
ncbi:MAG: hypothetical protein R3272_01845 [Candidatus Promineifilaceae bacterium]|nr:hypothetical protein [Candidatus Promineifilaceae bacterium]